MAIEPREPRAARNADAAAVELRDRLTAWTLELDSVEGRLDELGPNPPRPDAWTSWVRDVDALHADAVDALDRGLAIWRRCIRVWGPWRTQGDQQLAVWHEESQRRAVVLHARVLLLVGLSARAVA